MTPGAPEGAPRVEGAKVDGLNGNGRTDRAYPIRRPLQGPGGQRGPGRRRDVTARPPETTAGRRSDGAKPRQNDAPWRKAPRAGAPPGGAYLTQPFLAGGVASQPQGSTGRVLSHVKVSGGSGLTSSSPLGAYSSSGTISAVMRISRLRRLT